MINDVRNFILGKVASVVATDVLVNVEGDVVKPDAMQTRVRVKVFPRETSKLNLGVGGLKEAGGLVQVDVFGPRLLGIANIESIAESIVASIPFTSSTLDSGKEIRIWSVWADQILEEPTYLHLPVFVRWSLTYY